MIGSKSVTLVVSDDRKFAEVDIKNMDYDESVLAISMLIQYVVNEEDKEMSIVIDDIAMEIALSDDLSFEDVPSDSND